MGTHLQQYLQLFEALTQQSIFGVSQVDKEKLLLPVLNKLHQHHVTQCTPYQNIFSNSNPATDLEELDFLAVRLFKNMELASISSEEVFKVLQSSGTTGQTPARILLDKQTSSRQSKVLVKILQQFIGKERLPMLIIDSPAVLKNKALFSARGAGIQGLAFFGRDHTYALDENMQLNWRAINEFVEKYQHQQILIFGFTFMVWQYLVNTLIKSNQSLSLLHGIMLHSGGWKKLEAQKVDNRTFKDTIKSLTSVAKVHNFYGMAEQVGSVFVECEQGHLHAPVFADVIIRSPFTLAPCESNQKGIIQVLSSLPTSYPGHSILTEDLGTLLGVDDCPCGRKGKYFSIQGRLPKTEVRGCGDTHGETL